jgi:glycosyltransferase involved in cell wall biosynthesis
MLFGTHLWWVELRLIIISILNPSKCIFHIIYGENLFKNLGKYKNGNIIALTLHQPVSYFQKPENSGIVKKLINVDKIIVMSEKMEIYFRSLFPDKAIKYIPHGIDTNFFCLGNGKKNNIFLLGNWLRNFSFAAKVFRKLVAQEKDIYINVLTNIKNHEYFTENHVTLLHKVDDYELRNLYQQSKVLFLPLNEFTANNAILEGMSCGCQVVVSTKKENIPKDNASPIVFIEENEKIVSEQIINFVEEWEKCIETTNHNFVEENYSWNHIGMVTKDFLINS